MQNLGKAYNIRCPKCSLTQDVILYDSINVDENPQFKDLLMKNKFNRVICEDCEFDFRVDLPLLYRDLKNNILIHWIPETNQHLAEDILEEFDEIIEHIDNGFDTKNITPNIRLVMSRVELIELIYLIESSMNERVVEYIKYNIYSRNKTKVEPKSNRLLLNVEDSDEHELCFVIQNIETNQLGEILRYGRASYSSLQDLFNEDPEEFLQMFPGPYISARYLLLEEAC
ncbi:MAG: CpXC domain-containing protein [Pontiellaceae bacterium]